LWYNNLSLNLHIAIFGAEFFAYVMLPLVRRDLFLGFIGHPSLLGKLSFAMSGS